MSRSRSTNDTGQQTEQLFVKGGLCFRVVRGDMQDVIHIHVHVVERCQSSRVQFIRTFNIMQRRRRRRRSKVTVTSVVVVVLLVVFSSVCFRLSEALLELFLHHLVKPRDSHYDVRVYIFSRKRAACLFLSHSLTLSLSLSLFVCVCVCICISIFRSLLYDLTNTEGNVLSSLLMMENF